MNKAAFSSTLFSIGQYHCSGTYPGSTHASFVVPTSTGNWLSFAGTRIAKFSSVNEMTSGVLTTPQGTMELMGCRNLLTRSSNVEITSKDFGAQARLTIPKLFGLFSVSRPAELQYESFHAKLHMPKVRSLSTTGKIQIEDQEVPYVLFSREGNCRMFANVDGISRLSEKQFLFLLSSLFYFCLYPQWVYDAG